MAWIKRFDRDDLIKITATLVLVAIVIALFLLRRGSADDAENEAERAEQATTRAVEGEEIAAGVAQTNLCEDTARATKAGMASLCEAAAALADQAERKPLPGRDGVDGQDGEDGLDGANGVNGLNGKPGASGSPGPKGENGTNGLNGADSTVPGPQGDKGDKGEPGTNGTDGLKGDTGDDAYPFTFTFQFVTRSDRAYTCSVTFNEAGDQAPSPAVCEAVS